MWSYISVFLFSIPFVSCQNSTSNTIELLFNKKTNQSICISHNNSYPIEEAIPVCRANEETFHKNCFQKCSILTNGTHPIRCAWMGCCQEGCSSPDAELWNGKCFTKCDVLTNGLFPRRITNHVCGLSLDQWNCSWYNPFPCMKISGLKFWRRQCHGFNVGNPHLINDTSNCPPSYKRVKMDSEFAIGRRARVLRCNPGEILHKNICFPIVSCPDKPSMLLNPTTPQMKATGAPTEAPTEAPTAESSDESSDESSTE